MFIKTLDSRTLATGPPPKLHITQKCSRVDGQVRARSLVLRCVIAYPVVEALPPVLLPFSLLSAAVSFSLFLISRTQSHSSHNVKFRLINIIAVRDAILAERAQLSAHRAYIVSECRAARQAKERLAF